uniref:INTS5_C domain-containing protein n=1 Tax=Globodera pallida TaxID=36090 RepID=A0A183BQP0_GLOPA
MNVQPPSSGHLQSPKVPVQNLNWSKELGVEFGDTLVSDLLRRVFGAYLPPSTATRWQNVQFFEQLRNDLHFQWTLLRSVLVGDNRGKLNAKLLAILCWTASEREEWPQRTLARLIFAARDEKELANLVSLVVAMLPQLCQRRQQSSGEFGLMSAAVLHSLADARRIGAEWNQFVLPNGDSGLCPHNASRVVENVLTLIRWQQNAPEDSPIRHMGISLPDVRGQLQDALLGWALDYVDDLLQHGQPSASTREGTSSSPPVHLRVLDTFFSLMRIVVPQVQLPLRYHNKLLTKICALIVAMLRLVDRSRWGTPDDGVDFVCRCFAISGKIFTAQIGASKTHLLAALVDEVFGSYDKLFGTENDDGGHPSVGGGRDAGARFNFSAFQSLDFLNADKKNENSLFRDLRQMTMEWRSAAEVAHNGTLPRRKRRPLACTQTEQDDDNSAAHQNGGNEFCRAESAFVRRLLFLNMVENLCAAAPGATNGPYDPEMCQFLGQLLVDRFGGDGLTSHFCWLDWDEHERELNPQYLLVSQQLDRCPLVFDLLLLLSDLGFHGLYFCLPLIKAQFVTALAQLECTPLKDCLLSASIRQRCTQIFALLISANFFPGLIDICVEMLAGATNHESAVLMRDLWDFLKLLFSVSLSPSSLHPSDSRSMPPPPPNRTEALNSREGRLLTSTIVLIGQRHIASMGPLLAKLMDFLGGGLDGVCVEDGDDQRRKASMEEGETVEDEWAIERFHQPTAIPTAEIKRG